MAQPIRRMFGAIPPVRKVLPLPSLALASVVAEDGSAVYASSDTLYKGAIFGRDSLEVAEDLLYIKPGLVHNILLTLGRLQGVQHNDVNEEDPGKIIHEYRSRVVDGRPIRGRSLEIFSELSAKWGGDDQTLAYYASVDATPHFLRTLHTYTQRYGSTILGERVTLRDGQTVTLRMVAERAVSWLVDKLEHSRTGFLEYQRRNPESFLNHVWKDSNEFYVHESGEPANHDLPIASIEVQGLAFDGLQAAAAFLPERREYFTSLAERLRAQVIDRFWLLRTRYFALGTDFSQDGQARLLTTATSNPASLLDTAFFDSLPEAQRQLLVESIVGKILSADFLTNAGIRSRSLTAAHLVSFWDHHGSYVSWPKDTYDIAKGLRRQGFPRLAVQLENRLLNLVRRTGDYPEFVYVDGWGRVLPGTPRPLQRRSAVPVTGKNAPERIQAWTISAIMAILSSRSPFRRRSGDKPSGWQAAFEHEMLLSIPHMNMYINPFLLWLRYPTYDYQLGPPPE